MAEATLPESHAPHWSPRALLLAWSFPVAMGTPVAVLSLQSSGQVVAIWRVLLIVAATWYVWAAMTPVVARLADRWRLERPLTIRVAAPHLLGAVTACAVQAFTTTVATQLLAPSSGAFAGVFFYWFLLLLPAGVVVYAAVVGLRTAAVHRADVRARERQVERLAAQLSDVQLTALRAQIQPHFLFNTLNAVIALVRDHATSEAVEALTTLSSLLRTALRAGATHEVTLGEELAFTTNYLAIERLRFGARLSMRIDVPPEMTDVRVPSFLLQPFVENAVRHGLHQQRRGLHVTVSARIHENQLIVLVQDDGAGLATDWEERCAAGFGIANSRARLRQLYGAHASLTIARRSDAKRTCVEIALPLHGVTAPMDAA